MPRFRRISAEVDAVQFRADAPIDEWPEGVEADPKDGRAFLPPGTDKPSGAFLPGPMLVDGDWILTSADGYKSVCPDCFFLRYYEKVSE